MCPKNKIAVILSFFFSCTCLGYGETADFRQFTIFEDPNVYAGFPAIFQMQDKTVVSFVYQKLEALRKTKQHAHFGPAAQSYYAETTDCAQWKIGKIRPEFSNLLDISQSAAPVDSESFVSLAFRYKPGTTLLEPNDIRIFKSSSGELVFAGSLKQMTGSSIYMHDVRKADNGGFLVAGYMIEADKPTELDFPNAQKYLENWPQGYRRSEIVFLRGSPDAKSWEKLGVIKSTAPYGLCEPSFMEYDNGRIVCPIRTDWNNKFPKELTPDDIMGTAYFFCQSESNDGGKTWSNPKLLDIWGHPPYLLKLKNGNLLMVYGHRRPPYTIRSIISFDQGRTWDKSTLRELYTFEVEGGWDIGYPVAVQLPDGRIFCCFYGYLPVTSHNSEARGIYGCVFTESWAAAKNIESK